MSVGRIDVVGPHNHDHGRAAGCGLDAVHSPGCLYRTKADREPIRPKFDVLGDALGRSAERLRETEKIAVEAQSGLDVAGVEIDQGAFSKHVEQMLFAHRETASLRAQWSPPCR